MSVIAMCLMPPTQVLWFVIHHGCLSHPCQSARQLLQGILAAANIFLGEIIFDCEEWTTSCSLRYERLNRQSPPGSTGLFSLSPVTTQNYAMTCGYPTSVTTLLDRQPSPTWNPIHCTLWLPFYATSVTLKNVSVLLIMPLIVLPRWIFQQHHWVRLYVVLMVCYTRVLYKFV